MGSQSFFHKVACGLLVCKNDPYSTIIEANDAFYSMVGYTKREMLSLYKNRFSELVVDSLDEILKKVDSAVQDRNVLDYEYKIRCKSNKIIWIHDIATYDPEENVFHVVIMDITYKEKQLERVTKAAAKDKITGLLNREALEKRIVENINNNKGKSQTMFLIDLDNFKAVNDLNGHQVGDEVLAYMGRRLRRMFSDDYIVGRLGGDEFMMLLTGIQSDEDINRLAKGLVSVLKLEVKGICVSSSVGIVFDKQGSCDFKRLYELSDKALYKAKHLDKDKYEIEIV